MCICVFAHVYVHMCMCTCICVCVCVYVYVHMCMCVCVCAYVYVHMCMCICVYVYMHMCKRVYVYVHMCTCMKWVGCDSAHGWRVQCQESIQIRWRMTQGLYGGHSTNCRKGFLKVLTHYRCPQRQVYAAHNTDGALPAISLHYHLLLLFVFWILFCSKIG